MPTHGIPKEEVQRRAKLRAKQAEQRKQDAVRALEDRKEAQRAEEVKTQRLRALRLAHEAKLAAEAEKPQTKKPHRKIRTARKS
jgi:hypothetical protein